MEQQEKLILLFEKYIQNNCLPEEVDVLMDLMKLDANKAIVTALIDNYTSKTPSTNSANDVLKQRLEQRLNNILSHKSPQATIVHRTHFLKRSKWWAAAAILLLIATTAVLHFNKIDYNNSVAVNNKDIEAPKSIKANITLANGKQILLDSLQTGATATEGNTSILKTDNGKIEYNTNATNATTLTYNVLNNPRGSQVINITLEDGSKVWLNSESSLKFPVAFIGNERRVVITGEAYFEVAKNPSKKFVVEANGTTTEVLGTHFNVNTYNDDNSTKVTLLEGAVKVSSGTISGLLKPNEQANISKEITIDKTVNIEAVMAWKNGQFFLKDTDIRTLMLQIARWYNVDVVYEGSVPDIKFGGSIDRNVNLSIVLMALQENGIKCNLTNGKIIIK